ncbi:multidrug effflux MFS transporter [Aurantiacibacter poecillastricola]|uniref:multidrug effflux MFS transporter n=1 Tax=Aurantiacibacter poecillastricola TaxID=3064385 RepID=UPI00273F9EDD|nr:multidrug effflux MFS transporter [Aurantiacibacter sp. 219JJ12-13]MDP5263095.1 multidrug effflux MFS transporter [Aurantiacibacter sp. 219JJ12-13]
MTTLTITAADGSGRQVGQREFIVLMAALMSLNALAIDAMLPALDDIASAFSIDDPNRRQLVVGVYLLATGFGSLVPGLFADRYGRRPVLFVSLAIYLAASLLCMIAPSFEILLALRAAQGFGTAGLMVLPAAIIRDRFDGDKMARLISMIFIVFMAVPVLAPTLGQAVLTFASWEWIFFALAFFGIAAAIWAALRLPETLDPRHRQKIDPRTIVRNLPLTLRTRAAVGYVLAAGLTFGAVFGYINSAQQLIGEHFGAQEEFPLIFGASAATLAFSSFANSRIVERFGARRVSHTALIAFILVSVVQVYAAEVHADSLAWFFPLISINLCLLGFLGANFGSIAMQPFFDSAGAASSVQSAIRMLLGAVMGIAIGQAYDGTALPLAVALLASSLLALALVLFSERGKLFTRPRQPRYYTESPH